MAQLTARERLRYWRQLRGLSQTEFAYLADTSVGSISRKESGKQGISAEEIERFARVLGLTPAQFYGEAPATAAAG